MKNTTTTPDRIKSFSDLVAWQKAHKLVVKIYLLAKEFPDDEKFGLTSQVRRSAVSITSNIAEGFGRLNGKDKIRYYNMAVSSLAETQSQLLVARDVGYISSGKFDVLASHSIEVRRLILGLIKSTVNYKRQ